MRSAKTEVGGLFVTLALTLAACAGTQPGTTTQPSRSSATPISTPSTSGALDQEHLEAQAALDRWASAVSKAGGPPWFSVAPGYATGQVGDWEVAMGSDGKVAVQAGALNADPELSDSVPAPAEVRWADGVARTLPLVSARDALAELRADGNGQCGDCHPLIVSGARLSTAKVTTSRGQATVPAWEFTLEGTSVRVTYLAVSPAATAKVAPHEGVGRQIDSATGTRSGRVLTVTFTGSPGPGSRPCGADYDAEAVESSLGVVVIVREHRYVDPDPSASPIICTSEGAFRMANVELAQPLGDRAVLDPKEGLPVPVTLTN
ncbi:MAG: hypothetical protein E6J39_07715 [Chloroflexi bacterium]|nr:MAG: hypothetical protein E6J39_07715 [Chloroflexota bacterium]